MSEPVQTFMLERRDHVSKTIGAFWNQWTDKCPASEHKFSHRFEIEVPLDMDMNDVRTGIDYKLLVNGQPTVFKCACGLDLTPQNSHLGSSTSRHVYTNPRTGKSDTHPHLVATPGAMWECPWLVDGREIEDLKAGLSGILSIHYVQDWLGKRPPICVMCPDGKHWMPDQKSNNGTGWTVTGDPYAVPSTLHASPSIDTGTYHAFLQNGVFGADPNCVLKV